MRIGRYGEARFGDSRSRAALLASAQTHSGTETASRAPMNMLGVVLPMVLPPADLDLYPAHGSVRRSSFRLPRPPARLELRPEPPQFVRRT